jgi:mRNA-degrading endonuclease RelE of RelBE toxin-antitoxin system
MSNKGSGRLSTCLAANRGHRDASLWWAKTNVCRVHVGDYRVVYEVHDDRLLVQVIRTGHRRDVYRQ